MPEAKPLTKQEARELSRALTRCAEYVGIHRADQAATLTPAQRRKLVDLEARLLNEADTISAIAGQLTLAEAGLSLAELKEGIAEAEGFLGKIAEISQGITVLTAVLSLAAAIAAKDPKGILKQAKALKQQLKA